MKSLIKVLYSLWLLGVLTGTANALSFDHDAVLYPKDESSALSAQIGVDGSLYITLQRTRPTVVKVDQSGKMIWAFESDREEGVDKQFQASIPQNDGSVIVCGSRDPLPGRPSKHYPGFVLKLDSHGNEIKRYDPIQLPEADWPIWSALICGKWGNDIFFAANPPASMKVPPYSLNGQELDQKIIMRISSDLTPIWVRTSPVYHTLRVIPPSARTFELSDSGLLILDVDRVTQISGDGITKMVKQMDCLMLGGLDGDPGPSLLRRLDSANRSFQLLTLDRELNIARAVPLDGAAAGYRFVAGRLLPGHVVAIGGEDQDQQGDLLIFNSMGKQLGSFHFPRGNLLGRTHDRVLFVLSTDNKIIVVTQSYKTDIGNTIITWLKMK